MAETLDSEIATQNHVLVATEEFFSQYGGLLSY